MPICLPQASSCADLGPGNHQVRRWPDLLIAAKRRMAREDPELFAT
jgi:hypothetical protein